MLLGLPASCKLYGLRHLWITQAICHGVPLKAVAELAGLTTTAVIERVYCHLAQDLAFLSEAAKKATSQALAARGLAATPRAASSTEGQGPHPAPGLDLALLQQLSGLIQTLTSKLMPPEQTPLPAAAVGAPRLVVVPGA